MGTVRFLLLASVGIFAAQASRFRHRYAYGHLTPSCYLFVLNHYPWLEAKSNCQRRGGNLVSIDSMDENEYLVSIIKKLYKNVDFWAGGNDISSEGVWQWVADHRKFSYTNWYPKRPNNIGGNEHCLDIQWAFQLKWNDAPCGYKHASICERAC